jgi:hypothetical protein
MGEHLHSQRAALSLVHPEQMRGNLYALESNSGMICRDHNCRKESEEGKGSFKKDGENKMEGSIYSHHNQSRHITK